MNADGVQPSALVLSWVARKTDSDLLATLARVERTASRIVRGALQDEAEKRGLR